MEKFIQFTEEQKSLIWRTKVQPLGGTADDARIFVEVCEQYGLDPILGDIVFQRYETKKGPVTNFIVSRDGYLKAAMRDKNFVKCVSAVIKEGDDFEMDIEGNVRFKFGKQRGKIIGAWSYAEHATRGKLPVVVDFAEYFRANAASQNGRSPIWDSMPSAMIQKVAEVAALRRQFPLGGIVIAEEMGLNDDMNVEVVDGLNPTIDQAKKSQEQEKTKKAKSKKAEKPSTEKKKATVQPPVKEEKKEEASPIQSESESETGTKQSDQPTNKTTNGKTPVNQPKEDLNVEQTTTETGETPSNEVTSSYQEFTVLGIKNGETPQGTQFSKVAVQDGTGRKLIAYARGEVIDLLDEVEEGMTYLFDIQNVNGYENLVAVGGLVNA